MANGSLRFKDDSGNVISFISGSGTDIVISGGTLNLLGMTEVALGNVTISGSTLVNGTQGNQGPQGMNGFQGPNGLQGTNGSQGNQGPNGLQGTTGAQGFQGTTGVQGNQGITGLQGDTGVQGNQGPMGLQGTLGTQGTQGTQGTSGTLLSIFNEEFINTTSSTLTFTKNSGVLPTSNLEASVQVYQNGQKLFTNQYTVTPPNLIIIYTDTYYEGSSYSIFATLIN